MILRGTSSGHSRILRPQTGPRGPTDGPPTRRAHGPRHGASSTSPPHLRHISDISPTPIAHTDRSQISQAARSRLTADAHSRSAASHATSHATSHAIPLARRGRRRSRSRDMTEPTRVGVPRAVPRALSEREPEPAPVAAADAGARAAPLAARSRNAAAALRVPPHPAQEHTAHTSQ